MTAGQIEATWLLTPGEAPMAFGEVCWNAEGQIAEVHTHENSKQGSGTTFITPGLINTHTHLELYREAPILPQPGEPLSEWLLRVIAFTRPLTDVQKADLARQSVLECLHTGTTTVNDITSTGQSAQVLADLGLRGIVSPEFFGPGHVLPSALPPVVGLVQSLQATWAGHPRIEIGVSPHSPYNVSPGLWQAVLQALSPGTRVHSHLAESQAEWDYFIQGVSPLDTVHEKILGQRFGPAVVGKTPTQAVESVLSPQTTVAHGVFCTPQDIDILIQQNVGLAHCPRSNQLLNGQTVENLSGRLSQGLRVGLGTDSRLSCPDLDLRAEGREAQHLHGLDAKAVFELLTWGGARAIHQENNLGRLALRYQADVVLWHHPESPWEDPYAQWLSPQTQVQKVWVGGCSVL